MREIGKHYQAFLVWYGLDRAFDETATKLRVSKNTLSAWIKVFSWHERADALDEKARVKLDAKALAQKAKRQSEMLETHYKLAGKLLLVGAEYLNRDGLDNGGQAITAIKTGIDIQRKAEGLPDWLIEIGEMTEDELIAERDRILSRLAAGNNPTASD